MGTMFAERSCVGAVRDFWIGIALSGAFAILVCFVSNNLHPRFEHRDETIRQQWAILAGESYPINGVPTYYGVFQNRVLFPATLKVFSSAGQAVGVGSVGQWYLLLRLATAFGAFLIFWYLLRRGAGAPPKVAGVGLGLLAYALVYTFNHGWEQTNDFPDVAFTALLLWAAMSCRRWTLLLLAIIAGLNRESSVFAGIFWIFLHGVTSRLNLRVIEIGFGMVVSLVSYLFVLSVRGFLAGPMILSDTNFVYLPGAVQRAANDLSLFLQQPNPSSWPVLLVALVLPPGLWILANRGRLADRDRRLLAATAAIFLISVVFGQLREVRDFMTSIVLLVYLAVAVEAHATEARASMAADGEAVEWAEPVGSR